MRTAFSTNTIDKIIEQTKCCPTCGRKLHVWKRDEHHYVLACPDLFHGKFTLTFVNGGWLIEYNLKAQALL